MKSGKMSYVKIAVLFATLAVLAFAMTNAAEKPKKTAYTVAEMPQVMAATLDQKIINNDAEKAAILSLLERGQLIILNENTKKTKWLLTSGELVNAKPETLFKVISDIPNYNKFMPMTEYSAATTMGDPNIVRFDFKLKIKVVNAIPAVPMSYSVLHYHQPPYRSDWTYYDGNFEANDGFYQFVPVGDGSRTMAFYTLYSLARLPIAKSVFEKDPNLEIVMNMSTAVMVAKALKKRAEEIEGRTSAPAKAAGDAVSVMTKDPQTIKLLLSRGGLILLEPGKPIWATTVVGVNAPPTAVYSTVTQFENYPCYQSQVTMAKVVEKSPTAPKVSFALDLNYAILSIPLKYTLAYSLTPSSNISWKWAAGDLPSQQGSWALMPLEDGKKTLAVFRQTEDLTTLPGLSGAGLKSSIAGQPTLEPAILGSQALLVARSTRDYIQLSPADRKAKSDKCVAK